MRIRKNAQQSKLRRQFRIPAIGALGLLLAVAFSFMYGNEEAPVAHYSSLPPSSPYKDAVWGTGVIEANTKNIAVGTHASGIVATIFVTEGDEIEDGTPLFQLDDRTARSDYQTRVNARKSAEAVKQSAEVALSEKEDQLARLQGLQEGLEVSSERLQQAIFAVEKAHSDLQQATAQLGVARAEEEKAHVLLDQMNVYAPVAGRILKINISPGEFVTTGEQPPPVLMGNDRPLYLRVSIDENDIWRFDPKGLTQAALRSHKEIRVPLKFVRVEPYVVPKQQLNNSPTEKVDTRVLEVIYRIEGEDLPLYIGQQMDVFIQAAPRKSAPDDDVKVEN